MGGALNETSFTSKSYNLHIQHNSLRDPGMCSNGCQVLHCPPKYLPQSRNQKEFRNTKEFDHRKDSPVFLMLLPTDADTQCVKTFLHFCNWDKILHSHENVPGARFICSQDCLTVRTKRSSLPSLHIKPTVNSWTELSTAYDDSIKQPRFESVLNSLKALIWFTNMGIKA